MLLRTPLVEFFTSDPAETSLLHLLFLIHSNDRLGERMAVAPSSLRFGRSAAWDGVEGAPRGWWQKRAGDPAIFSSVG
jgi:hypothetical protein